MSAVPPDSPPAPSPPSSPAGTGTATPTGPRWSLPRGLIVLLGVAGAAVAVAGMRSAAGIIGPAFLAVLIVIAVHPVQAWLQRHRVPSWLAALLTMGCAYAVLLGLAAALALSVARLATLLPTYGPQFTVLLDRAVTVLDDFGVTQDQIRTASSRLDLNNLLGVLQQLLGRLASVLSDLLFILAFIFALVLDASSLPRRLAAVAAERPQLVTALLGFARGIRRYIVVSTVFGLIVAVINVAALYWLAVPLPLLWGLLSFITNYIPNIGFVLGLVPPALLGLLSGGIRTLVLVVVLYSVINFVVQTLIQPKYLGDAVGLSVTLTFLSLVFWSYVIGPLGALLAVPLSLLVKALLVDVDPASRWLAPLITGDTRDAQADPARAG